MEESKAIDRLLRLLDSLVRDEARTPLNVHADRLGLPTSTAYRMVQMLRSHGLVAPAQRGHYMAGLALSKLARQSAPSAILAASARPLLRRLARDCRATAHLGVMDGDMITYIVKEHGGGTPLFTQEGGQLEAYCSAIGRVLLANLPRAEREAYLAASPFVALTRRTVIDPKHIHRLLAKARRQDFAVDDREIADDLVCYAVPVRIGEQVVAAISLSMTHPGLEMQPALDALHACAARLLSRLASARDILDHPV